MQTIEEQKAAAETELEEAEQSLATAQTAFDHDPSDANDQQVVKCQDELGKAQRKLASVHRLGEAEAQKKREAELLEARTVLAGLNAQLTEDAIAKALVPLVEREKIARIELMNVLLELERVGGDLREACYEAERVEDALHPSAAAVAPAINTRANARSHRVAASVSVTWARLVNAALEQAVALSPTVPLRDPRRNALRAVQI